VRGVAGQEQPAILHRLHHQAVHGDDALVDDAALGQPPTFGVRKTGFTTRRGTIGLVSSSGIVHGEAIP
jgi:hypothetical protein